MYLIPILALHYLLPNIKITDHQFRRHDNRQEFHWDGCGCVGSGCSDSSCYPFPPVLSLLPPAMESINKKYVGEMC